MLYQKKVLADHALVEVHREVKIRHQVVEMHRQAVEMHRQSKFQQSLQSAFPLTTSFVPRSNVYGILCGHFEFEI